MVPSKKLKRVALGYDSRQTANLIIQTKQHKAKRTLQFEGYWSSNRAEYGIRKQRQGLVKLKLNYQQEREGAEDDGRRCRHSASHAGEHGA